MSKKFQVTLTDDLTEWLELEAKLRGLRTSSLIAVLLGESRRNQDDRKNLQVVFDKIKVTTPEDWKKIVESEFQKSKNKQIEGDKNDDV